MKKYYAVYIIIGALFTINLNAQKVDLKSELISLYEFNGNADDMSGNGNHGVLYGPVSDQDRFGNSDKALFFDGVDDYIEISPVSDCSNIGDFTIAVWANCFGWEIQSGIVANIIDMQYIFDGHTHSSTTSSDYLREGFTILYVLKPEEQNYVYNTVFYSVSNFYSNQQLFNFGLLNTWHHIVFIRKGNATYHYFDGVLVRVNTITSNAMNMNHNWFIGTFSGNNTNYNRLNYNFYGILDDLYIYDRAINACEVEALYSSTFPPER